MRVIRSAEGGLAWRRFEPLDYPGNDLLYGKASGINNLCVHALLQRCHATPSVASIALANILQKGRQGSIETFFYQLFIAAASALFGRCGEKDFKQRVREYDRRHITPFRHQTRRPSPRLLSPHKSLTH